MPSSHPITTEARSAIHLMREQTHQPSLRECTTRRYTQYFASEVGRKYPAPVLTSRVQWNNGRIDEHDDIQSTLIDVDHDLRRIEETAPSPVLSEIDELIQSDGEHSQTPSRPSSTRDGAYNDFSSKHVDAGSSQSYTDSSDTERRNPNFPGGRNIIDDSASSVSPSPPTVPRPHLEPTYRNTTPKNWNSLSPGATSSLGLRLIPPTKDDRNKRIKLWRVESAPQSLGHEPCSLARYSSARPNRAPFNRSASYSPSLTASSVPPSPPSPPPILPPIRPHPSLQNQVLPSVVNRMPGPVRWNTQEQSPTRILERLSPQGHESADDCDYGDSASLSGSPNTYPHPLHGIPPPVSYPSSHALPLSSRAPAEARDKNKWIEFAQVMHGTNGQTEFRCVYPVANNGSKSDFCGYTAKRHYVKRHVETRHLQFKDHICQFCGKAFPQRVSLMIHVNRHTGEKPHKCRFEDCDKVFSDPACRHKHMVEHHGYNPQGPRKRHRTTDSYHANSHFETLAPWVAKPDGPEGESRK